MDDGTTGTGFRFGKVATWGPAILMVLGFVLFIAGEIVLGALTMVAALLFWFIVRRRKRAAAASADAAPVP